MYAKYENFQFLIMVAFKRFQRVKEDFVCKNCGLLVYGGGYTNHCPHCLWSKHVDVNPGDRHAECQGLMRPVFVDIRGGRYVILHRCESCGHEKWNKAADNDDFEAILRLSGRPIK